MLYLTGSTNDTIEQTLIERGFGLIVQPGIGYNTRVLRYLCWAADNGCFAGHWKETRWLTWLDRMPRDRCLFAVAPDVYPDPIATLQRSTQYLTLLRDMGFPVAYVAQDGAEHTRIPWDDIDCLFLGGKKQSSSALEWKLSPAAEHLVRQARARGLWCHMGRVNSRIRLERARAMGCHSADGSFISKGPDVNLPRVTAWGTWLRNNQTLPGFTTFETPSMPVHRDALQRYEHIEPIP